LSRATVFEDRIYLGAGYSLRRSTGTRTSWTPDVELSLPGGRPIPAPGLGLIFISTSLNGFAFYPRAEAPGPVSNLAATAAGNRLELSWDAVAGATSYLIEVGSTTGAFDLATLETTSATFSGTASDGRYYVRVRASNDGGEGPASNELQVGLGANACVAPPGPTGALAYSRSGRSVTLEWPAGTGPAATRYLVEVGSTPGDRNLATFDVGTLTSVGGTVPPGTYFVRVIAENLCGASAASNEVSITVP
jgi:titin